jgi:hypothetical protein
MLTGVVTPILAATMTMVMTRPPVVVAFTLANQQLIIKQNVMALVI